MVKKNTRKTSQNFNPELFCSLKEKKTKWKKKRKIIILLCYSKHVKISFHYVLNAPCAYYAFLISTSGENSSRNLNVDRKDGSVKNFCSIEKCYLFLRENENVSQRTRYTAFCLSFGLWFAFHWAFLSWSAFITYVKFFFQTRISLSFKKSLNL